MFKSQQEINLQIKSDPVREGIIRSVRNTRILLFRPKDGYGTNECCHVRFYRFLMLLCFVFFAGFFGLFWVLGLVFCCLFNTVMKFDY